MALAVAVLGCGGSPQPGSASGDPALPVEKTQPHDMRMAKHAEPGEAGEHAAMPPAVAGFHDVLAPRWHAEHGAQRIADTCAAIPQLKTGAAAIAASTAPAGASAEAWADGAKQLAAAVDALAAPCDAKDAAAFEPAFAAVHQRFHHVLEAAMRPAEPAGAAKP